MASKEAELRDRRPHDQGTKRQEPQFSCRCGRHRRPGVGLTNGRGGYKSDRGSAEALQAQISALQKEVEKAKAAAASVKASAEKSNSGDLDLHVKWRGAPELSSADGKFKMKVRGRLQADYNAIDQDEPITGEPDVSAATIRRARLGVESVVWGEVKYIVEVDFATIPLRSGMPMSSTRASPKTSACVLAISRHSIEG